MIIEKEFWMNIEEFKNHLKENGWPEEDIQEELDRVRKSGNVEWNQDGSFIITIS